MRVKYDRFLLGAFHTALVSMGKLSTWHGGRRKELFKMDFASKHTGLSVGRFEKFSKTLNELKKK